MILDTTVYYNGDAYLYLNERLIRKQGLTQEQVDAIKALHIARLDIEEAMKNTTDRTELKALFEKWTENQFDLQSAWGFEKNAKYHKFWYNPQCTCAKLDNDDAYPTGYYSVNCECPVHGEINK